MRSLVGLVGLVGLVAVVSCGGGAPPDRLDEFRDESTTPVYGRVLHGLVRDLYGTFPDTTADAFVAAHAAAFGVRDVATELSVPDIDTDGTHTATTYHRLTAGVPIEGAEIRIHHEGGAIVLVTAPLPSDARIASGTATIAAADAEAAFRAASGLDAAVALGPSALVAYNPGLATGEAASTVLTYRVRTAGTGAVGYVDATSGQVVALLEELLPVRDRRVAHYRPDPGCASSACDLGEILAIAHDLWFDEGGSLPDATPTAVGGNLFDALGDLHAYYLTRFGRDGLDGAGKTVWAILDHPASASPHIAAYFPYLDALFFRDNAVSPEAVAHEYAHGVIVHSTGLGVGGQPGALNEALADALSVFFNGASDWTIRLRDDELVRDLAAPPLDHYDGYTSSTGSHRGSGVFSLGVYLLVNGGAHPTRGGAEVIPVVATKVEQIVYRALARKYVQPASDLNDGVLAMVRACVDLAAAGAHGIELRDCGSVWNAFAAVGLGDPDQDRDAIPDSVDNCPAVYNPAQGDCVGDPVTITHCSWFDRETGSDQLCWLGNYETTGCDLTAAPVRLTGDPAYPTIVLLDRPAIYREVRVLRLGVVEGMTQPVFAMRSEQALPDVLQYGTYLPGTMRVGTAPDVAPPLVDFGLYEIDFVLATDDDSARQAGVRFMIGTYSLDDCWDASH